VFAERSDSSSDRCVTRLRAAGIAGGAQLPLTGARRFAAADSEQQARNYRFGTTDSAPQTWRYRLGFERRPMKRACKGAPAAHGRRAVWEETPNAGGGRRHDSPSTARGKGLLLAGRRIFQTPKPSPIAAQRERQTYRARASAAFMTEAAALPRGRWQPVGPVSQHDSAPPHPGSLGWKGAAVRPLACLGIGPRGFF